MNARKRSNVRTRESSSAALNRSSGSVRPKVLEPEALFEAGDSLLETYYAAIDFVERNPVFLDFLGAILVRIVGDLNRRVQGMLQAQPTFLETWPDARSCIAKMEGWPVVVHAGAAMSRPSRKAKALKSCWQRAYELVERLGVGGDDSMNAFRAHKGTVEWDLKQWLKRELNSRSSRVIINALFIANPGDPRAIKAAEGFGLGRPPFKDIPPLLRADTMKEWASRFFATEAGLQHRAILGAEAENRVMRRLKEVIPLLPEPTVFEEIEPAKFRAGLLRDSVAARASKPPHAAVLAKSVADEKKKGRSDKKDRKKRAV